MQINLREYQKECISTIFNNQDKYRRQLAVLATGLGKTIIFSALCGDTFKNKRCLILANREKLLKQTKDKYLFVNGAKHDNEIGILDGTHKNFNNRIIVAGIDTISNDKNLFKFTREAFDVIIVDETHLIMSPTYLKTIKYFGGNIILDNKSQKSLNFDCNIKIKEPLIIGFTATPFRNDNKNLGSVFQECIYNKDILWALTQDTPFLCPPIGLQIDTDIDISKITNTKNGDFNNDELATKINIDYVNTLAVEAYQKLCPDEKCIVFCCNKEHAHNVCDEFNKVGIKAAYIDSDTPIKEREIIYSNISNGLIKVFVNCLVGTVGFDEPSLQAMINLRPTQSKGLFTQMVGRILRLYPNKQYAKVIDIAYKSGSRKLASLSNVLNCTVEKLSAITLKKKINNDNNSELWDKQLKAVEYINTEYQVKVTYKDLIKNINKKYVWLGDKDFRYIEFRKGDKRAKLIIKHDFICNDKFNVYFEYNNKTKVLLEQGVLFEWAFSFAETFLSTNISQKQEKLVDANAEWRKKPISDKQKEKILKWFSDEKLLNNAAMRIFIKNNPEKFMGLNRYERLDYAKQKHIKSINKLKGQLEVTSDRLNYLSKGEAAIIISLCIQAFANKTFRPFQMEDGRINVGVAIRIYRNMFYKIFTERLSSKK